MLWWWNPHQVRSDAKPFFKTELTAQGRHRNNKLARNYGTQTLVKAPLTTATTISVPSFTLCPGLVWSRTWTERHGQIFKHHNSFTDCHRDRDSHSSFCHFHRAVLHNQLPVLSGWCRWLCLSSAHNADGDKTSGNVCACVRVRVRACLATHSICTH